MEEYGGMPKNSLQQFMASLTFMTDAAIKNGNQKWGRQLATTFESHAVRLRLAYGPLTGSPKKESRHVATKPKPWDEVYKALQIVGNDPYSHYDKVLAKYKREYPYAAKLVDRLTPYFKDRGSLGRVVKLTHDGKVYDLSIVSKALYRDTQDVWDE